jgi:hypothetical protein
MEAGFSEEESEEASGEEEADVSEEAEAAIGPATPTAGRTFAEQPQIKENSSARLNNRQPVIRLRE